MIKKQILILILNIVSVGMLAGCGFKLQGRHELPKYMKKLIVITENNNEPFQVQLRDVLQSNGVVVITNKNTKNASALEINTPVITQEIHSYNSKGQVSQYRLIATSTYKLFDNAGKVLQQNIINRMRTYGLNPNQVLSNDSEKQIISEELSIEIINELIRQLSAL